MNGLEIITETPFGVVSYSEINKQFQLSYKNMIVFIHSLNEFQELRCFFEKATPNCCGRHSPLRKKYVFRINGTQTFFAFDDDEISELKKLLEEANFKTQLIELLNSN